MFHRKDWAEFKLEEQRFALQKVETMKSGYCGAMVYFMTSHLEQHIKRLEDLGARLLEPPEIHSYGKLARFQDPEGNIFGLYAPPMK